MVAAAHSRSAPLAAPPCARSRDLSHHTPLTPLLLGLALLVSACGGRTADAPAETAVTGAKSSVTAPSTPPLDFSAAGLKAEKVRGFLQALKSAVAQDARAEVASLVSYPITVRLDGQPISLDTPDQFVDHYSAIMSDRVTKAVEQAELDNLFVNYQGVRLGRGEVWCAGVYEEGQETYRIKIVAINN